MSHDDLYATCDGRPLILHWEIDRHLFYVFEVDTEEAERVLPEPLQVVEVRPGAALLSVALVRYRPGQFGPGSPRFFELVAAVHVAPDLGTRMPLPVMTLSSFAVLSDSQEFVAQEEHTLFAPARLVPLTVTYTPDELGLSLGDADGPILSVPSAHPRPRWVRKEMWGQHFTDTKGLHQGIWQWDGCLYEHQRPLPGWTLHPHPFWAGLDPGRVRGLYRTMVQEPGTVAHTRFWKMRPVAS